MRGPIPAMGIFLLLLFFLCVTPVCSIFDNVCPRKDPPPGVLVVSPGSRLELTCTGQVKVNGVKVALTGNIPSENKRISSVRTPTTQQFRRNRTFTNKVDQTSTVSERYRSPTTAGVSTLQGENKSLGYPGIEPNTSSQVVTPTPPSKITMRGESDRKDKEVKPKAEYKDEEWEEGSRIAKGVKMRPRWKWNKQLVQIMKRDWGEISFLSHGSSLILSSIRRTDAGKYTCHQGGEETFSVKVIVADPQETPRIHCYKKSPRSKIRCEWRPQNPVIKHPDCYLFLSKGPSHRKLENFHQIQCSYSSQRACCWCAVEHNDDELRTLHEAFLCVRSFLGNTTSPLIHFIPLDILKPDPPSNVSAHPVERLEKMIMVTWNLPISWNEQDYFFDIIYEISYRPLTPSSEQVTVRWPRKRHYTISDAQPDVEYVIQLRSKEEYDGQWSEWTSPVFARSWKANVVEEVDLTTTVDGLPTTEDFGSGFPDDHYLDGTSTEMCSDFLCKPQYHVLWISALFAVMSALLAVYIFRHKNRFMSKLLSLSAITHSDESSLPPPSIPSAPEQEALVSGSGPQLCKHSPPSDTQEEEQREEEQTEMDQIEAMNFNNKSYFYLQMEP